KKEIVEAEQNGDAHIAELEEDDPDKKAETDAQDDIAEEEEPAEDDEESEEGEEDRVKDNHLVSEEEEEQASECPRNCYCIDCGKHDFCSASLEYCIAHPGIFKNNGLTVSLAICMATSFSCV
ncbi:hypothetical protein cypCar_00035490, partial [Cyprinus carpio]